MTAPSTERALSPDDIVKAGLCIGCGACVGRSTSGCATMGLDSFGELKPQSADGWSRCRSQAFTAICPFSPSAADEDEIAEARFPDAVHADGRIGRFEAAYVGHVEEDDFRERGSSGGMGAWAATELLRTGEVDAVAHVAPGEGGSLFGYRISRSPAEVRSRAKSRYYPVELSSVVAEIRAKPGRYAIVGVPCFIKAVHLLREQEPLLAERIRFTLGLFCGHMKSARMAESFTWQLGARIEAVEAIDFRLKDPNQPANWYTAAVRLRDGSERRQNWWHFVDGDWGAGFFQNSACNFCDDVTAETADIAFGDAWVEPYSSDGRGTNVVVVRSRLLDRLVRTAIAQGRLKLTQIDADFVHQTQAAGFRQRREGLALRLSRRRAGLPIHKRVAPVAPGLSWRRRLVYGLRVRIGIWSRAMFLLARLLRRPWIYTQWARIALSVYQGAAYSRGRVGIWIDRLEGLGRDRAARR